MSADIPVTVFTDGLKEGEIKDIVADLQKYIVETDAYVISGSTVNPAKYGYHNSPGGSADLHLTVVIKEGRGDVYPIYYIKTLDGTVWDKLHVPKGARAYAYTKGNVYAVLSADDFKRAINEKGQTKPKIGVKTYWVSTDGKTTDEIDLTTLEKIKDVDRNKIVKGNLHSVPKKVYDKVKAGGSGMPVGAVKLVEKGK